MAKRRATLDEQIETLRRRGVVFEEMGEDRARYFLTYNSYYFKLKSYENNYQKIEENGSYRYVGIDFAYLVELSLIDFALSRLVWSLCSNIEHSIKVDFNQRLMEDPDDGIAEKCVREAFHGLIPKTHDNPYTNDLLKNCHRDFAPWHLWELLALNDQLSLYEAYYKVKKERLPEKHLLFIMRKMRNAVSHGNCLFADMGRPVPSLAEDENSRRMADIEVTNKAMRMCGREPKTGGKRKSALQVALDRLVVNNYAAVLICHLRYVNSPRTLRHACDEVSSFIKRANRKREEYFGSTGRTAPRNVLVNSTLEALATLSNGYIEKAEEKAAELEEKDAYGPREELTPEKIDSMIERKKDKIADIQNEISDLERQKAGIETENTGMEDEA